LMPQATQSVTASAPAMAVRRNRMGLLALETDAEHSAKRVGRIQVRGRQTGDGGLLESGKREEHAVHELREKAIVRIVANADVELESQAVALPRRGVLRKNRARVDEAAEEVEAFGDVISDRRLGVDGRRHTAEELTPENHVHVVVGVEAEVFDVAVIAIGQVDAESRTVDVSLLRAAIR